MPRPNRGPRLEANARGVYEIHWTENGRSKRVSTRTADAVEAADAFATWRRGLEREHARAAATTVRGLLAAYFDEHVVPNAASQGPAASHRKSLEAHFGDMHPAEILPADVRRFVALRRSGEIGGKLKRDPANPDGPRLRVGVGLSTIRRDLTYLIAALNHAVEQGRMKASDVPSVPLPEEGDPRARWLTADEVAHLFAVAERHRPDGRLSRIERWLFLAYYTGRRKRAVERLEWSRVDWDMNTIDFDEPGRRKTKKRRGIAYMNPRLRAAMERAFVERERGEDGRLCPWVLDHPGDIRKAFETLRRRAGFGPDVTIHVMKHTCITHMLRCGISIWDVAGAVATSPATITRVYGKHAPEAQKKAMEALT